MRPSFSEALEREHTRGDEWLLGAVVNDLAAVPSDQRLAYAPKGVRQFNNLFDTAGCASRAPLNILETKLTYFFDHGMDPAIKSWLREKGYLKDGRIVLNDAFIEILSGTGPTGNSLKSPVEAIYRYGVIPAHYLPLEPNMAREEYYNPNRITEEMRKLGREFLLRLGLNFEKVEAKDFGRVGLVSAALHAWPTPVNDVYPKDEGAFNHAIAVVDGSIYILDNYEPFTKLLAKDYLFFDWGYAFSITRQTPDPVEELSRLAKALQWILTQLPLLRRVGAFLGAKM